MEFLVTMTTQVPAGTSDDVVADVRRREAAHSHDLAEQGLLLRLWRPPVEPGEWRTLGLFSGENGEQLEKTLASMPLRVWRRDEVTPLAPHPNDPAPERRAPRAQLPEFFHCLHVPDIAGRVAGRGQCRHRPGGGSRRGTRGPGGARTAVAAACGSGTAAGAGLVAGRRSAADARHSRLTADGELDDGADDAVGGASERPCCDLNELTTDALRKAVSDDQMVSPVGQEAAGCRRRRGTALAPVHARSSPARPDQASDPSRGSSARPVRWVRRQPGLHHPLRRPLRRMTPRQPAGAAQPTRSSPVHLRRAGEPQEFHS